MLLLLSLSGCSTRTVTEIKYITIPDVYLYCSYLSEPNISDEAFEDVEQGDYKRLSLELTQDRFRMEREHNECVNNMEAIYKYQEKILKDNEDKLT